MASVLFWCLLAYGKQYLLNETIPGFELYRSVTDMASALVANTSEDYRLRAYFQTVMNDPANIPGSDVFRVMEADPIVVDMLVVKLG